MAKKQGSSLSSIAQAIHDCLKQHPEGLSIHEIRQLLCVGDAQQHFDRRIRDLYPYYIISRKREGNRTVYRLEGERPKGSWDYESISKDVRARILDQAKGRCQMCGKTITEDGIKLHLDHKVPRSWGGKTTPENLWAICNACNEGKLNYYATFSSELMEQILGHEDVHSRIAYLLKSELGKWVDSDLIQFVANFEDYQDDWQKRLRELRPLGFDIETGRGKQGKRSLSSYKLNNWVEHTENLGVLAKRYENERAKANKAKGNSL